MNKWILTVILLDQTIKIYRCLEVCNSNIQTYVNLMIITDCYVYYFFNNIYLLFINIENKFYMKSVNSKINPFDDNGNDEIMDK